MTVRSRNNRQTLVAGLKERGYDANSIAADDWDEFGFWELQRDAGGELIRDGGFEVAKRWQEWETREHYQFVRDWHKGEGVV